MAAIAPIADTGFLVALISGRDRYHDWAARAAKQHPPSWQTCEAVLTETFHLLEASRAGLLLSLLQRDALRVAFAFQKEREPVIALMKKYSEVPMSFADACLVRMSEVVANPIVLTTDTDFRIYRRHGRQSVPSIMPR